MDKKTSVFETTSTSTRLLEKRRLLYEVKEEFDQAKEQEREREIEFRDKEAFLKDQDLNLQQELIYSNQALQDKRLQETKSRKKYNEENEKKRIKEKEIEKLNSEIAELSEKATVMDRQVSKMRKYEDFLEKVKEKNPDEFGDISDILGRYTTLKNSYGDLNSRRHRLEEELQEVKRKRDIYEKETKDEILELNIQIAELQKSIEEMDNQRMDIQKEVENASTGTMQKDLELGCILTAIENLYQTCMREEKKIRHDRDIEKGQEIIDPNDYNSRAKNSILQLSAIKAYIVDIKDMVEEDSPAES